MGKLIHIRDPHAVVQYATAQVFDGGVALRIVIEDASLVHVLSPRAARTLAANLIQFADQLDAEPKGTG